MKRSLLLCIALILAQLALAGHSIEHALHEHDEACVECLILPGMLALPVLAAHPPLPVAALEIPQYAVPLAPTFPGFLSFRSRAPPLLHSC